MMMFDFRKNRQKVFPEITDWSGDHDELRYADPNKLNIHEWLWFHHICFKIIIVGAPALLGLAFLVLYLRTGGIASTIFAGVALFMFYRTFRAVRSKKYREDWNLYDVTMRDTI